MPLTIHVPTPDTPRKRLTAMEAPGRRADRVAGGWIADLVGLRQTIMLCPYCEHKFNPKAHHYELWRREWLSITRCDGCKQTSRASKIFIHESFHDAVGEDTPRRRGRWVRQAT